MSAIDPMTSASSTAGTLFAVWTSAIRVGESDSAAITVTAPTVFIQITSWEPASAVHAARKPGRRSGASADSSAGAARLVRAEGGIGQGLKWPLQTSA